MNIGFISEALPYLPSRGGFRLYGGNLIVRLSRRHHIDLVTLLRDDDADHLQWARQYCDSVTAIPARVSVLQKFVNFASTYGFGQALNHRARMFSILRSGFCARKWDVLHIEGEGAGIIVPPDLALPKVLSLHDSWTLRCAEMLNCAQNLRERLYYKVLSYCEPRFERFLFPRFERCTVVADRDLEEVARVVPRAKLELVPYGTDTEYFHPVPVKKETATLVFHSHLGYAPNIEAALEFADEIFPLIRKKVPQATFHLVGANPSPRIQELASRPGIKISANLPDLRPAVCSGQVYVCAIRYGTGLKSKMLEAMAMHMPIVCYPGSTVGLEANAGKHFLLARNREEFAEHVVYLLQHPNHAEELADAGRQLVEKMYSWASRVEAYEQLYQQIIEEHHSRTHGHPSTKREFSSR